MGGLEVRGAARGQGRIGGPGALSRGKWKIVHFLLLSLSFFFPIDVSESVVKCQIVLLLHN